jgi:hypothetical protein
MKHQTYLTYTVNDDGVWLGCRDCNVHALIPLGFDANSRTVLAAEERHAHEVTKHG